MNKIFYTIIVVMIAVINISCEDADKSLNQYIKEGPITYAGRIEELDVKSGYERVGVRILPVEDVNQAYCILRWNTASGLKDSIKVHYVPENYNSDLNGYYTILDMSDIEGNVLIEAWNVDTFGNKSLLTDKGGFVYGETYVSTLLNSTIRFSSTNDEVLFDNRVGAVGNLISYEMENGKFSNEIFVETDIYPLINAKKGGVLRLKTGYIIEETDIDTLLTSEYAEIIMPQ